LLSLYSSKSKSEKESVSFRASGVLSKSSRSSSSVLELLAVLVEAGSSLYVLIESETVSSKTWSFS